MKIPISVTIIFILLFSLKSNVNSDDNNTNTRTIKKSENSHEFVFTIVKAPFDSSKHDMSKHDMNIIDGKYARGCDYSLPWSEIISFSLIIDNEKIKIPNDLYNSFYNPSFKSRNLNAFWSHKYDGIFVYMNGSDGAGAYSVTWFLSKEGTHTHSLIPTYGLYFNFMED